MRTGVLLAVLPLIVAASPAATPADRAGYYDGGQMEIAAGLELSADGRFRYGLSYGALDEAAEGRWREEAGHILLTPTQSFSNDPDGGSLGETSLTIEEGVLLLPRHGRNIRFVRQKE